MDSWRKHMPDYEIKEWNEENFDVNIIPYTAEAYKAKKYAFVSDYARFWILYHYGGVYFDTDVEVIKPLTDIIAKGNYMGCEKDYQTEGGAADICVAPGLGMAVNPGLGILKELLDLYSSLHFLNPDGSYNQKTIVRYTTEQLCRHGLQNTPNIQYCASLYIYPKEYFCPIDYWTGKKTVTNNTYSIHHYAASWIGTGRKLKNLTKRYVGYNRILKWIQKKRKE